jgi:chaperonin cofactor prefoldin
VLKANQFVPEEVELINEIAELKRRLGDPANDNEREEINRKLNDRLLALNVALERLKRKR